MTGTTATYSYSAAGSATDVENFERLGQKIHPHDSEDYEPPLNGGLVGSADDTEWQCKASAQFWGGENGGFSDLPLHCQKRMLQDIATPLKDTFGWGGKKASSANVSILIRRNIPRGPHNNGPDNGWTNAANLMRAAALTSTSNDAKKKADINIGETIVNFKIPQFDKPPIDMSDTEWLDASISDWGDLFKELNDDFSTLKAGLENLSNPKTISKRDEVVGPPEPDPNESACLTNVLNPLAAIGFDLKDFLGYLNKGANFYDGATSTMDANAALGRNFAGGAIPNGWSVAQLYAKARGKTTGVPLNVLTSYTLSTARLTIFFNSNTSISSVGLLFHEALHGYGVSRGSGIGAYSDDNLKKIFDVTGSSDKITEHIDKYCGAYFAQL